ncbi:MAG: SxtJ family membrane protein [Smithella sp.]
MEQAKDTGMAIVLICLLISISYGKERLVLVAILFLLVNMIKPVLYRPVAKIWLGLSHILGTIMSKIILTIIFFLLVVPVGLFRRLMGKDALKLKEWRKESNSVFKIRDYKFTFKDIENPY